MNCLSQTNHWWEGTFNQQLGGIKPTIGGHSTNNRGASNQQ